MEALAKIESVRIGDDEIEGVRRDDGECFAALRRMCEVLGINPDNQREKLKNAPWAVTVLMTATGPDGKNYETFCLHVKSVAMWLATIDANRVGEHARPKIVRFQREAADVLYRWATGPLVVQTPEAKALEVFTWLQNKVTEQAQRLAITEPKAEVYDAILDASGSMCLRDAAKALGRKEKEWIAELVQQYLYRNQDGDLRPYSSYVPRLFELNTIAVNGVVRQQTKVTPEGLLWFGRKYSQLELLSISPAQHTVSAQQ